MNQSTFIHGSGVVADYLRKRGMWRKKRKGCAGPVAEKRWFLKCSGRHSMTSRRAKSPPLWSQTGFPNAFLYFVGSVGDPSIYRKKKEYPKMTVISEKKSSILLQARQFRLRFFFWLTQLPRPTMRPCCHVKETLTSRHLQLRNAVPVGVAQRPFPSSSQGEP